MFSYIVFIIVLNKYLLFIFLAAGQLYYYGNKINAAPQIVQVLWGAGTYDSQLTTTAAPSMASYLQAIVKDGPLTYFRKCPCF